MVKVGVKVKGNKYLKMKRVEDKMLDTICSYNILKHRA
jgi:hypothetical protein